VMCANATLPLAIRNQPRRLHRSVDVDASNSNVDRSYAIANAVLAAAVNSTVVAGENPTVGSTVWLPAESVAPGR